MCTFILDEIEFASPNFHVFSNMFSITPLIGILLTLLQSVRVIFSIQYCCFI